MKQDEDPKIADKIHFAVFAIEVAAQRMGITPQEVKKRLANTHLLKRLLIDLYEPMHSQSRQHIAEDITEAIENWERRLAAEGVNR